jgi:hypothetical protein
MQFAELDYEFGFISKVISVPSIIWNFATYYFRRGLKGR